MTKGSPLLSSTFGQHVAALALARAIRQRHPGKPIIVGGANCEGPMGQQTLDSFPFVDWVCTGPADAIFPDFVAVVFARAVNRIVLAP